jgi:hypothetical protein
MIRSEKSIRFTAAEVDEFRQLGLDMSDVKNEANVEQALNRWAQLVARERPDLLERIAQAMAEAKGRTPPPRLYVVAHEPD